MEVFDSEAFEKENPVIKDFIGDEDPFAERVNSKESVEPLQCWGCGGLFDRVSGLQIGNSDPEGEEVAQLKELCKSCKSSGINDF